MKSSLFHAEVKNLGKSIPFKVFPDSSFGLRQAIARSAYALRSLILSIATNALIPLFLNGRGGIMVHQLGLIVYPLQKIYIMLSKRNLIVSVADNTTAHQQPLPQHDRPLHLPFPENSPHVLAL